MAFPPVKKYFYNLILTYLEEDIKGLGLLFLSKIMYNIS